MSHSDHVIGNLTVRTLHSPNGRKQFGWFVGQKLADDSFDKSAMFFDTEHQAFDHAYRQTARRTKVDRINGTDLFKLIRLDGRTLYFETDSGMQFSTLTEARSCLGFTAKPTTKTPPKMAHAQNRKGYRADNHSNK